MDKPLPKIEISIKTILIGIAVFFSLRFAWEMRDLLLSLFIAYIIMSAAKQPVEWFTKKGASRGVAVLSVFLLFIIFVGFIISWIIPPFIVETTLFINHFPKIVESVKKIAPLNVNLGNFSFIQYVPSVTNNFFAVVGSLFSNVSFVVTTIFFSIYLTLDSQTIYNVIARLLSKQDAEKVIKIEEKIEKRLGQWLVGQLFLMAIIGAATYVGLLILGVKYALPLGIIAGVLEAIPTIGPTIAAIPAFLVGFSQAPLLGLFTLLLSIVIQQFENHIIVPMVMKRVIGLHPVVTLIALIVGGRYGGVLGMLFAIPLTLVVGAILSHSKD
ncbi:MAG: AI-2E family transporter [Microgenomates group bacterium]